MEEYPKAIFLHKFVELGGHWVDAYERVDSDEDEKRVRENNERWNTESRKRYDDVMSHWRD